MGRRKIEITEVKDRNTKQVTFSKRRKGLFKKANELSILCGAEVAIVVFSPGNKPYSFGHPSVDIVADKFLQQDPKSKVVESNNEIDDMDALNQQLSDVQAQISKEQKKLDELDRRFQQQKIIKLSQNQESHDSFLLFQSKVDSLVEDYFDAIEVSEYMLLLAKEPVVGINKKVTKKSRKN